MTNRLAIAPRLFPGRSVHRGLVLIQSQIASNVAAVDFVKGIDALYDEYVFDISDIVPQTDGTSLIMRFSTDGGSSFLSANYKYSQIYSAEGAAAAGAGSASTSSIPFSGAGNTGGETFGIRVTLTHPSSTSLYKAVHGHFGAVLSDGLFYIVAQGGTYTGATSAINAVRFLQSAGNISGRFKMFGVRK
jgi:hypothetical protein